MDGSVGSRLSVPVVASGGSGCCGVHHGVLVGDWNTVSFSLSLHSRTLWCGYSFV